MKPAIDPVLTAVWPVTDPFLLSLSEGALFTVTHATPPIWTTCRQPAAEDKKRWSGRARA
jgi:hypothetical protein